MNKRIIIVLGTTTEEARLTFWGGGDGKIGSSVTLGNLGEHDDIKPFFATVVAQLMALPATGLEAKIVLNPGATSTGEAFNIEEGATTGEFRHELDAASGLRALVCALLVYYEGEHCETFGSVRTCHWCGGQGIGTLAAGGGFHLFPQSVCLPNCVSHRFLGADTDVEGVGVGGC